MTSLSTSSQTVQNQEPPHKVRVLRVEGKYAEQEATANDLIVLDLVRKNKFSSAAFLSTISTLKETQIENSINYWIKKGKILRSQSGGFPKRYVSCKSIDSVDLESIDYEQTPYQYRLAIYFVDYSQETKVSDASTILRKYSQYMTNADIEQIKNCEHLSR